MKPRQRSAGIAGMLCALLLSSTVFALAASAEPPLEPTSRAEKMELLSHDAHRERERLAREYPFLQLPDMTPMRVVPDEEWPSRIAECLTHFGVDARAVGDLVIAPGLDASTLPGDVVQRTCELRFPKQSSMRYVLGPYELRQLWGYYVFDLQPCLQKIGVQIGRSPSFGEYLATRGSADTWHPYLAIPQIANLRDLNYYDSVCPRFPDWLRS